MWGLAASARSATTSAAGVAVGGPVHLVLHGGEELMGKVRVRVVVDARRVEIEHLAPEDLLGGTNVANAGEQLVEVVAAAGLLETLVVQDEFFDEVLPEPLGGPDAKLRAAVGTDAIAHREDHVQVVVLERPLNLPIAFGANL
jgi:hypothetical protein